MKRCYKCDTMKPLEEFHRCTRRKDGRQSLCVSCVHIYQVERWWKIAREKEIPGLLPDGTRRECACCGGGLYDLDPKVIRCSGKDCLKSQEVLGVTPTSPPINWTERIYGENPEPVEGLDRPYRNEMPGDITFYRNEG